MSQFDEQQIVDGKVMAVLAYLTVLCIIPLLFQKNNEFVLYHGKQGLVIFVAEVGIFILHILLGVLILKIGMFLMLLFSFVGIIAVLQGRQINLPVISEIAEKIVL
ncbi:MAG: hypothetical protein HQL26_07100 [Candidatus Omnitrophica bacterium]|nr:hypothetical protein [Candidatus Omnitrophota bacterium]